MYIVPWSWICVLQDGTLIGWEVLLTILWEFPLLAWATGKMQKNLGNLGKHFTKPLIQVTARPSMTLRSSLLDILRFIRLRFFRKLDSHSRKTRWRDEMAVQMRGADDSRVHRTGWPIPLLLMFCWHPKFKTKVAFQCMLLILKHNFCFGVNNT